MPTNARIRHDGVPSHHHSLVPGGPARWHPPWVRHDILNRIHFRENAAYPNWMTVTWRRIDRYDATPTELYDRALAGEHFEEIHRSTSRTRSPTRLASPRRLIEHERDLLIELESRRWGVEIECVSNRTQLINSIRNKGVMISEEHYNHDLRRSWKIVADGSLHYSGRRPGFNTMELVSPPLSGERGLQQLEQVCDSLREVNSLVNSSCGLHVHHDAGNFTLQIMQTLGRNWYNTQKAIDKLVSESRRSNIEPRYCHPISNLDLQSLMNARSLSEATRAFGTRYKSLNLMAYDRHGTVEIRQYQGTIEFTKIATWIVLGQKLIAVSERGLNIPTTAELEIFFDYLVLPSEIKSYFLNRAVELAPRRQAANTEIETESVVHQIPSQYHPGGFAAVHPEYYNISSSQICTFSGCRNYASWMHINGNLRCDNHVPLLQPDRTEINHYYNLERMQLMSIN